MEASSCSITVMGRRWSLAASRIRRTWPASSASVHDLGIRVAGRWLPVWWPDETPQELVLPPSSFVIECVDEAGRSHAIIATGIHPAPDLPDPSWPTTR